MKKFAGFLSVAVLSFTVVGCSETTSPAAPSSMQSVTEEARGGMPNANSRAAKPTIVGIATAPENIGTFSTLVAALDKAGMAETIEGSRQFTVFAPTNDAFDAAARGLLENDDATGLDLIEALDVATLTAVLQFHVTVGTRTSQSLLASGQVQMLDGNRAMITSDQFGAYIAGAKIIGLDNQASNGLVHVIDAVILPPSK